MNWYAIYTRPKSELKAKAYFEQFGIESFVPYQKTIEKKEKKLVILNKQRNMFCYSYGFTQTIKIY